MWFFAKKKKSVILGPIELSDDAKSLSKVDSPLESSPQSSSFRPQPVPGSAVISISTGPREMGPPSNAPAKALPPPSQNQIRAAGSNSVAMNSNGRPTASSSPHSGSAKGPTRRNDRRASTLREKWAPVQNAPYNSTMAGANSAGATSVGPQPSMASEGLLEKSTSTMLSTSREAAGARGQQGRSSQQYTNQLMQQHNQSVHSAQAQCDHSVSALLGHSNVSGGAAVDMGRSAVVESWDQYDGGYAANAAGSHGFQGAHDPGVASPGAGMPSNDSGTAHEADQSGYIDGGYFMAKYVEGGDVGAGSNTEAAAHGSGASGSNTASPTTSATNTLARDAHNPVPQSFFRQMPQRRDRDAKGVAGNDSVQSDESPPTIGNSMPSLFCNGGEMGNYLRRSGAQGEAFQSAFNGFGRMRRNVSHKSNPANAMYSCFIPPQGGAGEDDDDEEGESGQLMKPSQNNYRSIFGILGNDAEDAGRIGNRQAYSTMVDFQNQALLSDSSSDDEEAGGGGGGGGIGAGTSFLGNPSMSSNQRGCVGGLERARHNPLLFSMFHARDANGGLQHTLASAYEMRRNMGNQGCDSEEEEDEEEDEELDEELDEESTESHSSPGGQRSLKDQARYTSQHMAKFGAATSEEDTSGKGICSCTGFSMLIPASAAEDGDLRNLLSQRMRQRNLSTRWGPSAQQGSNTHESISADDNQQMQWPTAGGQAEGLNCSSASAPTVNGERPRDLEDANAAANRRMVSSFHINSAAAHHFQSGNQWHHMAGPTDDFDEVGELLDEGKQYVVPVTDISDASLDPGMAVDPRLLGADYGQEEQVDEISGLPLRSRGSVMASGAFSSDDEDEGEMGQTVQEAQYGEWEEVQAYTEQQSHQGHNDVQQQHYGHHEAEQHQQEYPAQEYPTHQSYAHAGGEAQPVPQSSSPPAYHNNGAGSSRKQQPTASSPRHVPHGGQHSRQQQGYSIPQVPHATSNTGAQGQYSPHRQPIGQPYGAHPKQRPHEAAEQRSKQNSRSPAPPSSRGGSRQNQGQPSQKPSSGRPGPRSQKNVTKWWGPIEATWVKSPVWSPTQVSSGSAFQSPTRSAV